MKHTLSIIIPCYNSQKHLSQAVESVFCYPPPIPFEVIFVDDGSIDKTWEMIKTFSTQYANTKKIKHHKNLGGGAARNTGVMQASGDLILCLDSDNFLDFDALEKILQTQDETNADGVAFHYRQFFYRSPILSWTHINPTSPEGLHFADLFGTSEIILDNFLYTKKAFLRTDGYPTNHGFDTQGFEVQFLAKNARVYVAPDSRIYHRQGDSVLSYFEREYEKGEFSKNMFLIYELVLSKFSSQIQQEILSFDFFKHSGMDDNLTMYIRGLYEKTPGDFFRCQKKAEKQAFVEMYNQAHGLYTNQRYRDSLNCCIDMITAGCTWKSVFFLGIRNQIGIQSVPKPEIEREATELIASLTPMTQHSIFRKNVASIIVKKMVRLAQKWL